MGSMYSDLHITIIRTQLHGTAGSSQTGMNKSPFLAHLWFQAMRNAHTHNRHPHIPAHKLDMQGRGIDTNHIGLNYQRSKDFNGLLSDGVVLILMTLHRPWTRSQSLSMDCQHDITNWSKFAMPGCVSNVCTRHYTCGRGWAQELRGFVCRLRICWDGEERTRKHRLCRGMLCFVPPGMIRTWTGIAMTVHAVHTDLRYLRHRGQWCRVGL